MVQHPIPAVAFHTRYKHCKKELPKLYAFIVMEMSIMYLKGLAMIFAGQENPVIIFTNKEIYIYFKTNSKIPINLVK